MTENVYEKLLYRPVVVLEKLPFTKDCNNTSDPLIREYQKTSKSPTVILDKLNYRDLNILTKNEDKPKSNRFKFRECSVKLNRDNLEELRLQYLTKCKFCNKLYNNRKSLEKHLDKKHIIVVQTPQSKKINGKHVRFSDIVIFHDQLEYHKCRKCIQLFVSYEELKEHMKFRHSKRKCYICNYCKTSFVDRMFFKLHIKLHCEGCGELSVNKANALEHKLICVNNKPECRICYRKFTSQEGLQDHSYDHFGIFYYCNYCKEKFKTKTVLLHHITIIHNNEKRLKTIKSKFKENSKRIGIQNYFKCDQCAEKFKIETDLIKHKWTHFLTLAQIGEHNHNVPNNIELQHNINKIYTTTDKKLNGKMNPIVLLERLKKKYFKNTEIVLDNFIDVNNLQECNSIFTNESNVTLQTNKDSDVSNKIKKDLSLNTEIKKKKLRKTLFSNYQCNICFKYFSSNYCLNRHKETQHQQCNVCQTEFLNMLDLVNHDCTGPPIFVENSIVHPVLLFDNFGGIISCQKSLEECSQEMNENCQNNENDFDDFVMPAPIVELTEFDSPITYTNDQLQFPVNDISNKNPVVNNNNSKIKV